MYGESSFTWEYVCGYETREHKRRRLFKKACVLTLLLCLVCLIVVVSVRFIAVGGLHTLTKGMRNTVIAESRQIDSTEEALVNHMDTIQVRESASVFYSVANQAHLLVQTVVIDEDAGTQPMVEMEHIPIIYLDPGHGGADEGCARDGILEKDLNLAIALLVRDQLKEQGYQVIMSRETDAYVAKEERVKEANQSGADIYISIHQNATDEDTGVNGMEVWYEEDDSGRDSKRLAQLIQQQTIKSTGAVERELRDDGDFHVTRNTAMPSCLIETGFLSNAAERQMLSLVDYQQQIAEGIVQGIVYYFHPKTMYLTFDDGPSEENTQRVLDILHDRDIKATFFLVGENVRKHPEMARRIVAEGHTIGIHCDNHDYDVLYESVDSYVADFEKARQTIYEVTGVETNLFRFPGGSINAFNQKTGQDIIREMTDRGYIYYDWNASLEDAVRNPDPAKLVANGVETTLGRKKVILLAHDVVYSTGICLEELLDSLPEYEMKPLSEDVEPICFGG